MCLHRDRKNRLLDILLSELNKRLLTISWSFLACAAVGIERKAFFALSFDGLHHVIGVLRALVIIITERECFLRKIM